MQQEIAAYLAELRAALSGAAVWLPEWLIVGILTALTIVAFLALHQTALVVLRRTVSRRREFLRALVERTRNLSRLALVIFALGAGLQAAPIDPAWSAALTKILLVALVALIGWGAFIAVNLAADLYLHRFRVDAADNLLARKHVTQVRILERAAETLVILATAAAALMTFDTVRQYGVGLFASAGVAGLIAGLAARPVLSNLMAGVQIAITQPIRIDDVVVVEGEWGWIEEITSTYVVIRIWDMRRLIVPLSYFIEKPFTNWTRESAAVVGAVHFYVDYRAPVDRIRQQAKEIVARAEQWDGKVVSLQVTDAKEQTLELRVLVSAEGGGALWSLRCDVRERLIAWLQQHHPEALPRARAEVEIADARAASQQRPDRAA
jgi:small-conductance mechanosensitive channel